MKSTNPFRLDPNWDWAFTKWGQPELIAKDHINDGYRYKCARCGASWVGPNGDHCDWCHQRWLMAEADKRQWLLFPEWLGWGDRYARASKLDREVWANTRGFRGDFQSPWLLRLKKAKEDGSISNADFVGAIERFKRWKLTLQLPP